MNSALSRIKGLWILSGDCPIDQQDLLSDVSNASFAPLNRMKRLINKIFNVKIATYLVYPVHCRSSSCFFLDSGFRRNDKMERVPVIPAPDHVRDKLQPESRSLEIRIYNCFRVECLLS